MFSFGVSDIITRNTNSYPITLSELKASGYSKFYQLNPTDTSMDSRANEFIAQMVDSWERSTKYLLLDQTIKCYVPDLARINNNKFYADLDYLNVRSIDYVKYYKQDWNNEDAKLTMESSLYYFTNEIVSIPMKFKPKQIIELYPIQNNLEVQIKGGFLNNDFSTLKSEIKKCLLYAVSQAIDVYKDICSKFYDDLINEIESKYSIKKQIFEIL